MSETLEYSVQLEGADAAARSIEDLKVKQLAAATQARELATQVRAAEQAAAKASGDAAVEAQTKLEGLRRQLVQTQSQASSYGQQASQLAAAQRTANEATQQAAQNVTALGGAISMAGGAVGHLNPLMGQMVSAMGQTVSQMPGLIAQFGSLGPVIGAASLAMAAWSAIEQAERAAFAERVRQTDRLMHSFQDLSGAITQARENQDRWSHAIHGQGTEEDTQAAFDRLQALRGVLGRSVSSTTERQLRGGYGSTTIHTGPDAAAVQSLTSAGIPELGIAGAALGSEQARREALGQVTSELRTLAAALQNREQNVDAAALGRSFFGTTATDTETAGDAQTRIYARHSGAGARRAQEEAANQDSLQQQIAFAAQEEANQNQQDQQRIAAINSIHTTMAALDEANIEGQITRQTALSNRLKEIEQQRQTEMIQTANTATTQFAQAHVQGLQAVIDAAAAANTALTALHRDTLSSGQVWAQGMTAIGEQVGGAIGTDLQSAFQSSLGAWLDGSKSFVQAAEDMAKGVIKSLVQEGIIQAIVETARGIADLASYHYDTAGLHFAAAGTWAAVAGVAGGVGAAVGAFGGGGAAGASSGKGAPSAITPSLGSNQGSVVNISLFAPNMVMTQAEQGQMFANAARQARRQLGPSAIRFAA